MLGFLKAKKRAVNFHSHNPEAAILNVPLSKYPEYSSGAQGQLLSVGIHPWESDHEQYAEFSLLSEALCDKRVVALGEVGLDPLRGAPIERQLYILRSQLKYAVSLRMPVVFHIVRRYDLLLELASEYNAESQWAVHGFRGQPQVARQLADARIYMSLGRKFNPESAAVIPDDLLLVETDTEPEEAIVEIIKAVADARGQSASEVAKLASDNLARFYHI